MVQSLLLFFQELYWNKGLYLNRQYNGNVIIPSHKRKMYKMDNKILQVIAAIIIPPLGVYMKNRKIDSAFWVNIVLTILGYFPGLLHALYVVLK
jgi:uncharacterized membrane protein YqaE (UPF0057 family)